MGGTNRENLCWVGYWERVHKLKPGLGAGKVYQMRIGKVSYYFWFCLISGICRLAAKQLVRQQFSELSHHKYFALIQKIER